ncbi:MAG: response regulator [Terrimonas sp.]|nr:response regulator [Terrimonas sp.]
MLKIIIIEDERLAQENLLNLLSQISDAFEIITVLTSVKESIAYLSTPSSANLIFSDVQLPDGLSFEIFERTRLQVPVIFVTGYNEFMMNAFDYNGIDYLLKPVTKADLEKSVMKYQMLQKHFSTYVSSMDKLVEYVNKKKKSRMIVKRGTENISLRLEDIVLFFTENKIVYVLDNLGKKYMSDKNLGELEMELDENQFFRANRQYIVNIDFIRGFKTYEKVKLKVDLVIAEINHAIIISQETAPGFRKWIYEA